MHNIMEDIAEDYLVSILTTRKNICNCERCKNDILNYALSRLPPKYVTRDSGAMYTIIENTRVEYQANILAKLLKAIIVVHKNPRH
ncbi:MAG: late competence development ComFB family protein [Candidatus Omnitrophota bacterium]